MEIPYFYPDTRILPHKTGKRSEDEHNTIYSLVL